MTSDSDFNDLCIKFHTYLILRGKLLSIKTSAPEVIEKEFTEFLGYKRNSFARHSRNLCVALKSNRKKLKYHSSAKKIENYETLIKDVLRTAIVEDSKEKANMPDANRKRLHEYFGKL